MAKRYIIGPQTARWLRETMGHAGLSSVDGVSAKVLAETAYMPPFTVRWSQSQNEGSGAWVVWIPDGSLLVNGYDADLSELSAAGADYGEGWYTFEAEKDIEAVYVEIDAHSVAHLVEEPDEDALYSRRLANVELTDAGELKVVQLVRSSINFAACGRFSISCGMIVNCFYDVGGKTYMIANQTLPTVGIEGIIIALKIDVTGSSPSAEIVSYSTLSELQFDQADETCYVAPLYKLSASGVVLVDFRVGPSAAMWEFPS